MMDPSPRPPRAGKRASRGTLGGKGGTGGGTLSITSWPRQAQLSLRECEGGPDVLSCSGREDDQMRQKMEIYRW